MNALEETFRDTMPPEMGYDYLGISFQEKKAQQGVKPIAIFGLSFLFVFLILAALYESWTLPFSVLLGTPIAVFGAFLALYCRGMVNNVYAQIGLVMLIGLAAKNAILIVEFARLEYEHGKPLLDAALAGARVRLRPILMTSFAFILGSSPLWTATGAGAISRRILGTVVIGGMLAATCIAVCLIPVTFYVVERIAARTRPAEGMKMAPAVTALTLMLGATLLWNGCAVGPNYKRPAVDAPGVFRSDRQPATTSMGDVAWWDVYHDDALQRLVREAFTNNYDLRIAMARVEEERQLAAQSRSQFFPSVNYNGTVSRGRNDFLGSPFPSGGAVTGSAFTTVDAFWEVDLWGRVRRLNESARAQFLATEEARRAVRISLLGDVATDYFRLLELDEELDIAGRTTNSFAGSLQIFSQRMEGGAGDALQTSRAQAALNDAQAAMPAILQQIAETENELSVLLGRVPGPIERSRPDWDGLAPPEIPAGLPSSLLERRPDVREAEQQLRSANALIGESVAGFFPKIGLTAFLGKVSPALSAYSLGTANAWGASAEATGPIFEGGRLVAQYREAKAARAEATLRYRQTTLEAFRDVSDALVSRDRLAEVRQREAEEVGALEQAVKLSTERYLAGKASYS